MSKAKQVFTEREVKLILALYSQGLTDTQVAKTMGYKRQAWTKMMHYTVHEDRPLFEHVKEAKQSPDTQVEASLFKRANGYDYTETEETIGGRDGGRTVTKTKHIPPDPVSDIFWLKNRRPERWRERYDLNIPQLTTLFQRDPYEKSAGGETKAPENENDVAKD